MNAPRYSHKSCSIVAGAVHLHEPPPADTNLRKPTPAEFSVYRVEVAIRHELAVVLFHGKSEMSSFTGGGQRGRHYLAASFF